MIIYKIQESGQATDFQFSRRVPKGWFSIDGDKIPIDKSAYNSQAYADAEKLGSQKSACIKLRREAEYHFSPNPRFKNSEDVEKWRVFCEKLDSILESDTIQEIPQKPFS